MTTTEVGSVDNAASTEPDYSDEVLYEVRGNAAWITINRPHRRNAMARRTVNQDRKSVV